MCATEPNEGNDLGSFELPDDDDELLTVDLSPNNQSRKRSKSFRTEKNLVNANATAPVKTTTGRISTGIFRSGNSKPEPVGTKKLLGVAA